MTADSIAFPHLGITLQHVGQSIHIFGIEIAYYGIVIACGMLAGVYLAMYTAKKTGQDPDDYFNFALIALVISVLGARAYYVIFSWDYYSAHPAQILNLRGGGLAIYGGVIAGVLTAVIYTKVRHMNLLLLLDTAMPGLLIGQVIGRWGNFFNREAFGDYTDSVFAMLLPQSAVHASDITDSMLEHLQTVDGISCISVHPTFLYESCWNLVLLIILLVITLRSAKAYNGQIFLLYLFGYGLGRLWIEGLRTDQLLWPGTGIAVSQVLSGVLVIVSGCVLLTAGIKHRKENRGKPYGSRGNRN